MNIQEYQRQWYLDNRDKILIRQKETNARVRKAKQEYVRKIKASTPCSDCGMKYPYYVMDFDHINDDKIANVGDMLGPLRSSWKALKEEIAKCEIVCSNCHRIRTHSRNIGE